jgi:hypothetical protein
MEAKEKLLVPTATGFEERLLHFRAVGQAVHYDVQTRLAEVRSQPIRQTSDAEIAALAIAPVFAHGGRDISVAVEVGIHRPDALEAELASV